MTNPEFIQSAVQFAHQAKELIDVGTRTNLIQMLAESGHPYGLILNISQSSNSFDQSADWLANLSFIPSDWYSGSVADSAEDMGEDSWGSLYTWGVSGQFKASSIHSSILIPSSAFLYGGGGASSFTSSVEGSSKAGDSSAEALDNLSAGRGFSVDKNHINFGTVSLKVTKFKGQEPFVIKTPQGEPMTEIKPESPLAFLHLNRQAARLKQMSPLERIHTMTQDLKKAFALIDEDGQFNGLNPNQQAILTAARSAVIVGISHLVPIFRRKTGLPFWRLDVLPPAIQQLHRLDSQAVSNQFGGKRKVKLEDIEMMVITPQMRRVLAVAY